jgi:protein-ribulosamine 3-kinase
MINWGKISSSIRDATQTNFTLTQVSQLAGGDSNQAWQLAGYTEIQRQHNKIQYFVKLNSLYRDAMFAAESAGLAEMAATQTVRVPHTITHGITEQHSFLVLEHFNLKTHGNSSLLGTQLAAMHRTHAEQFGWSRDNTIGVTPQLNHWSADWANFWREQRLGFQLDLAAHNGIDGKLQALGKQVLDKVPQLLDGYSPQPSLLHGDLWSGNHAFLADGTPLIFDPASYYGDREADIAMTELFGGFEPEFYSTYQQAYPLHAGYHTRKTLYNLYHILNHCNMVSSSYAQQAEKMMLSLLGRS